MLDKDRTDRDIDADKAAIMAAIASDFDSLVAKDKSRWETHWVQDERMTSFAECGPLMVSRGYEAFRDTFFQAMETSKVPATAEVRREKVAIHIDGDTAWTHFDQIVTDTGDPILPPTFTHNLRILVRESAVWKVIFHGVWALPGRETLAPTIEVDSDARVHWMNPAAEARLKTFPALTVSHGVLRTTRPALQADLEQALARAAKLVAYVSYRKAERDPSAGVSFPLLLGEDDDGQTLICKVSVNGGRLYVGFGDDDRIAHSIRSAAIVFGLSDAQRRLATRIAGGMGLDAAARDMGITLNTARTHLRRMFDKTGARTQAALLRIFLAMG